MTPRQFIPVPDTFKCEMRFTQYGQEVENVLYVRQHEPLTPVTMDAAGALLVLWWVTNMAPRTCVDVSLNEVKITDMSASDAPAESFTTGLPVSGTYDRSGLPGNVTLAVKLSTHSRGRSYTGRSYIVGIPDGSQTGNQVNSDASALYKAAYESLISELSIGGLDLVVVSFVHDKLLREVGVATDVTSVTIDQNLDSQRRRLTGRGK